MAGSNAATTEKRWGLLNKGTARRWACSRPFSEDGRLDSLTSDPSCADFRHTPEHAERMRVNLRFTYCAPSEFVVADLATGEPYTPEEPDEATTAVQSCETPGCRFDRREPEAVAMVAPGPSDPRPAPFDPAGLTDEDVLYLDNLLRTALRRIDDGDTFSGSAAIGETIGYLARVGRAIEARGAGR